MAKPRFTTVPEELLHVAEAAAEHFRMHGYRVATESYAVEYPQTPTIVAKRNHTTIFVEVVSSFEVRLVDDWIRYCRSCDRDVQFAIAVANDPGLSQKDMESARRLKIGVYAFSIDGAGIEIIEPVDLALRVELPDLARLPPKVRAVAAPFYKKFERGDWRDGFEDACRAVEERAISYLKSRISKPGVQVLDKNGRVLHLTAKSVDKMTLGALANCFLGVTTPNVTDSVLAKTLSSINPERIVAAHKRQSVSAERKLRVKAGQRMHAIVNCLRELIK